MEDSTCHEMAIHLSQRFGGMLHVCLIFFAFFFTFFFISLKYDFHVDAERMIV